jgi:hypothetical protein
MYFPYGIWRDAEREARRIPDNNNNGCGILVAIFIGGLLALSLFKAGGFGILLGLAVIIGIVQGLNK